MPVKFTASTENVIPTVVNYFCKRIYTTGRKNGRYTLEGIVFDLASCWGYAPPTETHLCGMYFHFCVVTKCVIFAVLTLHLCTLCGNWSVSTGAEILTEMPYIYALSPTGKCNFLFSFFLFFSFFPRVKSCMIEIRHLRMCLAFEKLKCLTVVNLQNYHHK